MSLSDYMLSEYREYGRGEKVGGATVYDCWGLTREIRHKVYGLRLLPSWGRISPEDKRGLTGAFEWAEPILEEGCPRPGSIACVFHGRVLLHVAVVVDHKRGLMVLETAPNTGPILHTPQEFEAKYSVNRMQVRYYYDSSLPE